MKKKRKRMQYGDGAKRDRGSAIRGGERERVADTDGQSREETMPSMRPAPASCCQDVQPSAINSI